MDFTCVKYRHKPLRSDLERAINRSALHRLHVLYGLSLSRPIPIVAGDV